MFLDQLQKTVLIFHYGTKRSHRVVELTLRNVVCRLEDVAGDFLVKHRHKLSQPFLYVRNNLVSDLWAQQSRLDEEIRVLYRRTGVIFAKRTSQSNRGLTTQPVSAIAAALTSASVKLLIPTV